MITLQEVIAQVQRIGAMKYPYLRKVKVFFEERLDIPSMVRQMCSLAIITG